MGAAASECPRGQDGAQFAVGDQAFGEGVANTAAERVDHVFFGMAIGRVVDPLAAAALAAVRLEGVLEPRAPRVDQLVAAFQQEVECLEPVQNEVGRPPGDQPRAEDPLVFRVGGRAQ